MNGLHQGLLEQAFALIREAEGRGVVVVLLERLELSFEISACPERRMVQAFRRNRFDESFYERMEQPYARHRLGFVVFENPEVSLPAIKLEEWIMIGTNRSGSGTGLGRYAAEHRADRGAVHCAGVNGETHNPRRVLIHGDHHPVYLEHQRAAAKEIQRPQTVLGMPEKRQSRRSSITRVGPITLGQTPRTTCLSRSTSSTSDSWCAIRWQPKDGFRRFISQMAVISSVAGPFGPGFPRRFGVKIS